MEENHDTQPVLSSEANNEQPLAETVAETPPQKKRFKHKKLALLIVGCVLVTAGISSLATYYLTRQDGSNNNEVVMDPSQALTAVTTPKDVEELSGALTSSYTWLPIPKQVDKLALFKNPTDPNDVDSQIVASITYYLIGNGADGSEVYAVAGQEELGGRPYLIVVKKDDGLSIIKKNSANFFYAMQEGGELVYGGPELLSGVTVDPTSSIADMNVPDEIVFKGQKFSLLYPGSTVKPYLSFMSALPTPSEYLTYNEVGAVAEGTIYESIAKDDPTYRVSHFELRLRPALYANLYLKGELSDTEVDPVTWNDGSKNTINYLSAGRGCGASNGNEIAKYGKDQLVPIGKSDKGQIIYGFKDNNNELLQKHYSEYLDDSKNIDSWIAGDESFYKKANFALPIAEYVALKPIYLVEDGMGRMLVFSRQDLVLVGGCAKPVVYAYPTSPTLIDVTVGADVTVSDPEYGTGWYNVMAMPNGLLGYEGKQYDSLFWEGYGHGIYPQIAAGSVVQRDKVEQTLWSHLRLQGLNEKESNDFMEFWSTKIPVTPYVRISWLGTEDMERLAPLYVSPSPDTRIRIFLDMEGLTEPLIMPAQKLSKRERTGFTVVEWGGLVTDGSVPLLR